jgi:tetratricopeptide (TPR) repeat protein
VKIRFTPDEARGNPTTAALDLRTYPAMWLIASRGDKPRPIPLAGVATPTQLAGAITAKFVTAAKDLVRDGFERKDNGDTEGALARFNRALVLNDQEPEAYFWRGVTKASGGDKQLAVKDLKRAIELKHDYAEAYDQLGYLLIDLKRYDEAIVPLTDLIAISPTYENGRAYQLRATAWQAKGEIRNALADAKQACTMGNEEACKEAQAKASP